MKNNIFLTTLLIGLMSVSNVWANEDSEVSNENTSIKSTNYINLPFSSYVSLKLGYANFDTDGYINYINWEDDDLNYGGKKVAKAGVSGSLSVGKQFGFFRPELEFSLAYMNMKNKVSDELVLGTVGNSFFAGFGDMQHKAKVNTTSLMLNLLFDIPTGTPFTPYLGMGAGYGYNKITLSKEGLAENATTIVKVSSENKFSEFSLGYQAMVGVGYKTSANIEFDLGYKYVNYGTIYDEDSVTVKAKANVITFGVKAPF